MVTFTVVLSVLDRETGEPIPDAEVYYDALLVGHTGPDGRFTIPGVSEGWHHIGAWKKGYRFDSHITEITADREIDLGLDRFVGIDFRVELAVDARRERAFHVEWVEPSTWEVRPEGIGHRGVVYWGEWLRRPGVSEDADRWVVNHFQVLEEHSSFQLLCEEREGYIDGWSGKFVGLVGTSEPFTVRDDTYYLFNPHTGEVSEIAPPEFLPPAIPRWAKALAVVGGLGLLALMIRR